MPPKTPERRPSLLSQHLTILGLEPGDAAAAASEKIRMDSLDLPPLTLASRQRSRSITTPLVALASALALLVVSYRLLTPDGLRVKGAHKVSVFWERDGQVEPFSEGVSLRNGDRVRAEVLAGSDAVAFLAVASGDGMLLSDPPHAAAGSIRVATGERKSFPGSVKLVGADEKERLVVIICQVEGAETPELSEVLKAKGERIRLEALPSQCSVERFELR